MNLFQKISALFKVKNFVQDELKEAKAMNQGTPGWKTSEFWLHLASQAAILWGAVQGLVPPKYAAIISTAGIAVYTIARTIYKATTDIKAVTADKPSATVTVNQ